MLSPQSLSMQPYSAAQSSHLARASSQPMPGPFPAQGGPLPQVTMTPKQHLRRRAEPWRINMLLCLCILYMTMHARWECTCLLHVRGIQASAGVGRGVQGLWLSSRATLYEQGGMCRRLQAYLVWAQAASCRTLPTERAPSGRLPHTQTGVQRSC